MRLLLLWISTSFLFASEPFHYAVALPERTYSGDWDAWIEFVGSSSEDATEIKLISYDARGRENSIQHFSLNPSEVFVYHLEGEKGQTVQTLWLETSNPITGMLWMYRSEFGQINGATIMPASWEFLIFPHVPRNYLEWSSSIALTQRSENNDADVYMTFYDEKGQSLSTELVGRSTGNYQYLRRTPNIDVLVGGLDSNQPPYWGEIRSAATMLSGYQSFTRQSDTRQTSVLELSGEPRETGIFNLNLPGEPKLQALLFANPANEIITVDVNLVSWTISEDELWERQVENHQITVEPRTNQFFYIAGEERIASILQFASFAGEEPHPIHAARFVYGQKDIGMGADLPSSAVSQFKTWFNLGTPFERKVAVTNISDNPITLDGRFLFASGTKKPIVLTLDPGETRFVGREDILLTLPEDEPEASLPMSWVFLQCDVRGLEESAEPSVLTTVIGQAENDFSLISQ